MKFTNNSPYVSVIYLLFILFVLLSILTCTIIVLLLAYVKLLTNNNAGCLSLIETVQCFFMGRGRSAEYRWSYLGETQSSGFS